MNPIKQPAPALRRDILIALALLATASAATLLPPAYVEAEQRISGVMIGLIVMYYANAVPKKLNPLLMLKDPARYDAQQRFTGQ